MEQQLLLSAVSGMGGSQTLKLQGTRDRELLPHPKPKSSPPRAPGAQTHRTPRWFGLEGTLKPIQLNPPALDRDTFH